MYWCVLAVHYSIKYMYSTTALCMFMYYCSDSSQCLFWLYLISLLLCLYLTDTKLRSPPGKFIPVFVDNKSYLMRFLESMTQVRLTKYLKHFHTTILLSILHNTCSHVLLSIYIVYTYTMYTLYTPLLFVLLLLLL